MVSVLSRCHGSFFTRVIAGGSPREHTNRVFGFPGAKSTRGVIFRPGAVAGRFTIRTGMAIGRIPVVRSASGLWSACADY